MSKAVISISSHVARGSVGNRAAVFGFEVLGVPVWSINTISLPWHPGHGLATRIVPSDDEFSSYLEDIANAQWIGEVGGVITGYMATSGQVTATADLIKTLRTKDPPIFYLCDPVIGDAGGLYVAEPIATAMKQELVPLCQLLTPNKFELEWLSGAGSMENVPQLVSAARNLGPPQVLVTSVPGMMRRQIGNLLVDQNRADMVEHREIDNPPNGPGDLTAALFLAHRLQGMGNLKNLQMTTASVFEILSRTQSRQSDELMLETDSASITNPRTPLQVRQILGQSGAA